MTKATGTCYICGPQALLVPPEVLVRYLSGEEVEGRCPLCNRRVPCRWLHQEADIS